MIIKESSFNELETLNVLIRDQNPEADKLFSELSTKPPVNPSEKKYYYVVTARYYLLKKDFHLFEKTQELMLPYIEDDKLYNFSYHYFNALFKFYQSEYEESLYFFKLASKFLNKVDPLERGEFYYNLSALYYEIDKITLSIKNVYKAYEIFKENNKLKRMADCHIVIANNNYEIKQLKESELHYNQALKIYKKLNHDNVSICYHNLGHLYSKLGKPKESVLQLTNALEFVTNDKEQLIKTYYLLSRECYRINDIDTGNEYYEKAIGVCKETSNHEYIYHLRVQKALYDPDYSYYFEMETEFNKIIDFFIEKGLWNYVEEYALVIAQYYKDSEQYDHACEFFDLAQTARERVIKSRNDLI
ncbi:tetratricopeptide repeat protein [Halalkalibacterium halodurans]|uniref:tetratricopeptide repeat protein n=1 Tax=Halalkalibacterium halodurans TaxID=86665 RepID=UPI0010675512|nr:tetratricopeptide repeat protein [Halalkalibacterium halodurans]TES47191.1 tetratricopeptide repeat protein [Halalkalibacterium halodurans]